MSDFATIRAESLAIRDSIRAASRQSGIAASDATALQAQMIAVLQALFAVAAITPANFIAALRAEANGIVATNGTGIEPALAVPVSSVVTSIIITGSRAIAMVGQQIDYVATLYDVNGNPVPSCQDSLQFMSGDDPTAVLPAVAPANTNASGQTPFSIKYTRSVGRNGIGARITDVDVPSWDSQTQSNATPGVRVIASVEAIMAATAVHGVAANLTVNAYDDGRALISSDSSVYYGLTITSSDAAATVDKGVGPHAVPYDAGANVWSPPFVGPFQVIFSVAGTYTVTVKFQSASAGTDKDLATPDIVLTVVVS